MQFSRWLGFWAIACVVSVVFIEPLLGWGEVISLTEADSDLLIIGRAVALVGVLSFIIGTLEEGESRRR